MQIKVIKYQFLWHYFNNPYTFCMENVPKSKFIHVILEKKLLLSFLIL